jgi:hypothetical protein
VTVHRECLLFHPLLTRHLLTNQNQDKRNKQTNRRAKKREEEDLNETEYGWMGETRMNRTEKAKRNNDGNMKRLE